MSEYITEKLSKALHEAKAINFPLAPELESFARGVEHGLSNALIIANGEQRTHCCGCGEYKVTPLRRDEFGGYICLTCIDKKLDEYLVEKKRAIRGL